MTSQQSTPLLERLLVVGLVMILATLACGLGQDSIPADGPIINRLPTLTPTADPANTPAENQLSPAPLQTDSQTQPVDTNTPEAGVVRLPTLTPTPQDIQQEAPETSASDPAADASGDAPTENIPASETPQWEFSAIKVNVKPNEGTAQILGDIINTSNFAQKLSFITGTFYDAQGNTVAGEGFTVDYWPTNIVPPGGKLPFELIVLGVQDVATYDLRAEAEVVNNKMIQSFEFLDVNSTQEKELFCLDGQLVNSVEPVQKNLVIIAVVFDDQDNVAGFADFTAQGNEANIQPLPFNMCTELSQPAIARHELRAWGE